MGSELRADLQREAIPTMEKLVFRSERSPGNVELLATAYARAGNRTEALRLIDELKQRRQKGYIPAGALINPYLGLRCCDIVLYLATSLKTGLLAHHHDDFAELALDS